jgi:uncharacterized OB-fold protein
MEERPFTDKSYEQFLNEEKIMGCRCKKCQALYLPPRPICIKCYGDEMEWVEMKGRGKLAAFTCIGIGPSFMAEEGFDRNNPYCSGVVLLDEGVRIDARIEGFDNANPETIKLGTPVTVEFLHRGEGEALHTFPAFKPV